MYGAQHGQRKEAEAKQRFSEVIGRSGVEPEKISSRDRLVAEVVSRGALELLDGLDRHHATRTLGELFTEAREICAEEEYALDVGERVDRTGWPGEGAWHGASCQSGARPG